MKGTNFINLRDAGDPVELAQRYNDMGADELVFLDITASHENRELIYTIAEAVASTVFIPFTVGGGIRSTGDIRRILAAGADKVSINTAAVTNPHLITEAAEVFGSQCVVVAIDPRRDTTASHNRWEVYTHGGRNPTGLDAIEWVKIVETLGAGEILLTSMDRDGTLSGYDLDLTLAVSSAVDIPVIASGGAGGPEHIAAALTAGSADAALVASIVHDGKYSIDDIKTYLAARGIEVRRLPVKRAQVIRFGG